MSCPLRIALVGQTFAASRTVQRGRALRRLGHTVTEIPITPPGHDYETKPTLAARLRYRLRVPGDPAKANDAIVAAAANTDIVWMEAAAMITGRTLARAKAANPSLLAVCYSEDDMMNPMHRSRWTERAFRHIDLWVTTKSFNTADNELPAMGVAQTMFVNNGFDPELHREIETPAEHRTHFGAPVGFIGTFEAPRARSLLALADAGIPVRVWGNGWSGLTGSHKNLKIEARPLYNEDYVRAINATDINLCFLRHGNRDLQTCRSVEIPACGGFMMHERSDEIGRLFRDNLEAVMFDDDSSLIASCRAWLDRASERETMGQAARTRAKALGLAHDDIIAGVLSRCAALGNGRRS